MSGEMELREALTRAGRVLAHEGQGDYVAGHVSLRAPGAAMFMKPAGIGLEEMSAPDVILVDFNGERIAGAMPRHNEVFIHTEIYKARSDVAAVVHTHPVHAVVYSSLGAPLLPLSADATIFGDIGMFDQTTDLIVTPDRGAAVARRLGRDMALILRNHGIVTVGASVEEAVYYALKLEQACRLQLMAASAGGARLYGSAEDSARRGARNRRPDLYRNVFDYVHRCACRAAGVEICEPIEPVAMVGRQTAEP